ELKVVPGQRCSHSSLQRRVPVVGQCYIQLEFTRYARPELTRAPLDRQAAATSGHNTEFRGHTWAELEHGCGPPNSHAYLGSRPYQTEVGRRIVYTLVRCLLNAELHAPGQWT